jgi:hypothetical protein
MDAHHPTCRNCYYTDTQGVKGDQAGYCRRYPPSTETLADGQRVYGDYPLVELGVDWCGEFRPRSDNAGQLTTAKQEKDQMKSKFSVTLRDEHLIVDIDLASTDLEKITGIDISEPDDFAPQFMTDPQEKLVILIYGVPQRSTTPLPSRDDAR